MQVRLLQNGVWTHDITKHLSIYGSCMLDVERCMKIGRWKELALALELAHTLKERNPNRYNKDVLMSLFSYTIKDCYFLKGAFTPPSTWMTRLYLRWYTKNMFLVILCLSFIVNYHMHIPFPLRTPISLLSTYKYVHYRNLFYKHMLLNIILKTDLGKLEHACMSCLCVEYVYPGMYFFV